MVEKGKPIKNNDELSDYLKKEFSKYYKKDILTTVKFLFVIHLFFLSLIIVTVTLQNQKTIELGTNYGIIMFGIIFSYIVLALNFFIYLVMAIQSEKGAIITWHSYYNPGTRPSLSRLDIDEKGIQLGWYKKDLLIKDSTPYHDYKRIPYDEIDKIHIEYIRNFFSPPNKLFIFETTNNQIGRISTVIHPEKVIIPLLKKYLGDKLNI